ncbi:MAG: hypothetical protein LBR42_01940 [Candidatus Methanoplasma sp.]|jgi:hypothetical protein|nr:hypothetical protein [Candidatus Methanoplasma sp.]
MAIMLAVLITVALMSFAAAALLHSGTTSAEGSLEYIDENGEQVTLSEEYDPKYLYQADLGPSSGTYTLEDGGWYVIAEDAEIAELNMIGDVHLIIRNDVTLNLTGGDYVKDNIVPKETAGSTSDINLIIDTTLAENICIYREAGDADSIGSLAESHAVRRGITLLGLHEGSSLTNTALIVSDCQRTINVFNGGTVENRGIMRGYDSNLIYVNKGPTNIINHAGALIENGEVYGQNGSAVYVRGGEVCITNHGTIDGYGSGISVTGDSTTRDSLTLQNEKGATISSESLGIQFGLQTDKNIVRNEGTIEGQIYGICSISGYTEITNSGNILGDKYEGIWLRTVGEIKGTGNSDEYEDIWPRTAVEITNSGNILSNEGNGISLLKEKPPRNEGNVTLLSGLLITNSGSIKSSSECGIFSQHSLTLDNDEGAVIDGTLGLYLVDGGDITNRGEIKGSKLGGVYSLGATVLKNYCMMQKVDLDDETVNDVSLGAGSIIDGDLYIGKAASDLRFIGDLDESSLIYSTVTGSAEIFDAEISIDTDGLPKEYGGEKLTLIKSSGLSHGGDVEQNYNDGQYTLTISADDTDLFAYIQRYGIGFDPGSISLDAEEGYSGHEGANADLINTGNTGTGSLMITYGGDLGSFDIGTSPTGIIGGIAAGESIGFSFRPVDGLTVGTYGMTITASRSEDNSNPIDDAELKITFTVSIAESEPPAPGADPQYTITSASDAGSVIEPEGVTAVASGGDMTYAFHAESGSIVSSVSVDGMPLSSEEVALGTYTFRNVINNHSIEVSAEEAIILSVTVVQGRGHAEYSIDGSSFTEYTGTVAIPMHSSVVVEAVSDTGYVFMNWWDGDGILTEQTATFTDADSSIYLELYFSEEVFGSDPEDGALWFIIGMLLLFLAGLFLLFLLFYRRSYEVVKISPSEEIIGKDRAYRKRPYRVSIEGGLSGTVTYKVGEDGIPKDISPDQDGAYEIPKQDVIDKLTIEFVR